MADYQQTQQGFVDWLRDPDNAPIPGSIEMRRLQVYRRLIANNVNTFLRGGFPVLREVLSKEAWQQLADRFIREHTAASPYFSEIGKEFVEFLAGQEVLPESVPAYTYELAAYERMEVEAMFAVIPDELQQLSAADTEARGGDARWYLNPSAQFGSFTFPVAWISAQNADPDSSAEGYFLLVFRPLKSSEDKASARIRFLQLNPVTAVLVDCLRQSPSGLTRDELTEQLIQLLPQLDDSVVRTGVAQILPDFAERGVLLAGR
ncbi:hypothetical protein IDSA_02550 [Pseudidiomarina salinarum]|uniref:Uncharacterized protein n=1 Tax=Pseudidiomarina salinarum TaxID=435908 RepID=A0A094L9S7_9GAMM|nr:putative DNA-binding domain-containing protein [Pseudidiomarina salinarum]KFZ31603.1 hypothetical protein IDSA_02550 [Pseudidiomarina salinarum]RUO70632.1 DUF2063 domain-containing protein [Pseudidiomarina salinarum]